MTYEPDSVQQYFDAFAEREWNRLSDSLQGRIKYGIHRQFVEKVVRPEMQVLDAGCGPGRFAIDLIELGAHVTLVDLSSVQLELARSHLSDANLLQKVTALQQGDITRLDKIDDSTFDVTICYGSTISYTCQEFPRALKELRRVTRPGGHIIASVTSLFGSLRLVGPLDAQDFISSADCHLDWEAVLSGEQIVYTKPGSPEFHQPMVLFTSVGFLSALEDAGLAVVEMASANPIVPSFTSISSIAESASASKELERLELATCKAPGLLDVGEHLIAVAKKAGVASK